MLTMAHPNEATLRTTLANHLLLKHPRVIVTPHIAFNTEEAVRRIRRERKGEWSSQAIQKAANRVASLIRERLRQDLKKPDRLKTEDSSGERG